ncbi:MAG: DUF3347 domain-containing protein [Ferruginibacter sp.]
MKDLTLSLVIAVTALAACNNEKTTNSENKKQQDSIVNASKSTATGTADNTAASMKEMVGQYLQIKNALANDNGEEAATAGKAFVTSMGKMEKTTLSPEKLKIWEDLSDDAKEMAGHIGMNHGKIDHQREHFDMLSTDMYDMVKAFGTDQTLYMSYCPMFNNNKGASWLSETKEIQNPYYGKKMLTCGSVKEEIK